MGANKSSIPVGNLYIVAFLILMALSGMSLYVYVNARSNSADYRMSAASLLKVSEEFKKAIDEERRYVIETVFFFIGSQGGVDDISEYNSIDISKVAADPEAKACFDMLKDRVSSPSKELQSFCFNNRNVFKHQDSEGAWKCDNYIYSYEKCDAISLFASKLCCHTTYLDGNEVLSFQSISDPSRTAGVMGYYCHQSCLNAVESGYESKCSNMDYCGALWCRANNLDIPETYEGVPYYYKIGDSGPGYFCPSSFEYSPERNYQKGSMWRGVSADYAISKLINLSNAYFYKPSKNFEYFIYSNFGSSSNLAFQLDFKGCSNEECRFDWVPYLDSLQSFVGRGYGGVPMITFTAKLMSSQVVPVPIEDMMNHVKSIIQNGDINHYLANGLKPMVLFRKSSLVSKPSVSLSDWNEIMGRDAFGISCGGSPRQGFGESEASSIFPIYDSRHCGGDPYNNDCNYNCLMDHASTKLYMSSSSPLSYSREGYDYQLRPFFRFVKVSLGTSVDIGGVGNYKIQLAPGTYSVFVNGSGDSSISFHLKNGGSSQGGVDFSHTGSSDYYESASRHSLGVCSHKKFDGDLESYYANYGCCPMSEYDASTGSCNINPFSNSYCSSVYNKYGHTQSNSFCFTDTAAGVDYHPSLNLRSGADELEVISISGNIYSIDIVRVDFDNTFDMVSKESNGVSYNEGGSFEYYKNTKDCEKAMGDEVVDYSQFSKDELWYSMLCLRSKGKSWQSIIEKDTGLFEAFRSASWDYKQQASDIDSFVSKHASSICITKDSEGRTVVAFAQPNCGGSRPSFAGAKASSKSAGFISASSVEEKLNEIRKNSSFISLPVKWNFAYRDAVEFNQTMLGEDGGCNLNFSDVGGEPLPDCSCRDCESNGMCVFDFNGISTSDLISDLYHFKAIFIDNANYKDNEVVR